MSKNYDSKKVDQDEVFYYIEDILHGGAKILILSSSG